MKILVYSVHLLTVMRLKIALDEQSCQLSAFELFFRDEGPSSRERLTVLSRKSVPGT